MKETVWETMQWSAGQESTWDQGENTQVERVGRGRWTSSLQEKSV